MEHDLEYIVDDHTQLYDHQQAGDIIQPFVKIRVLGHPCDAQSWQSNAVSGILILVMIKDH